MQTTSALYKRLIADPSHVAESKVVVAGTTYGEEQIHALTITRAIFAGDGPMIGCCVNGQLDLTLWVDSSAIPRMATIQVYTRIRLGAEVSEWLSKGTYWVVERRTDDFEEAVRLVAYDAMLFAEQVYLQEGDTGTWPRSVTAVVADAAQRLGVTLDSRTTLNDAYMVGYPNDYTIREILGFVAVMHGGNWIITDDNKLQLLPLGARAEDTHYLVTEHGEAILMGGVRILV